MRSDWTTTILAGAAGLAVWGIAASNGYALQMIWLPAVVVGATWPETGVRSRNCIARLRHTADR